LRNLHGSAERNPYAPDPAPEIVGRFNHQERAMMIRCVASAVVLAPLAGAAGAGTIQATGTVDLFGTSYGVTQWRVLTDAGTTAFDPESLTFYGGTLYAGADHGSSSGAGRLVSYVPGSGADLSAPAFTQMGLDGSTNWGPEGITVNTSGSGYGSFGPGGFKISSFDGNNVRTAVVNMDDLGSPKSLSSIQDAPESDDLVFVPSRNQFGFILDADGSIEWYDSNMTPAGQNTPTFTEAKGITVVSSTWVMDAFGLASATAEVLLVVGKEDNRLGFFDVNGTAIGSVQTLLPNGLTFAEIEGVAVDEANNHIFLADEAALSIHVITVPAPSAIALLGLGALGVSRRRR
jgi:hypothetical protein